MVEGLKLWEAVAIVFAFFLLVLFFLKMMAYVKVLSSVSSGVKRSQAVSRGESQGVSSGLMTPLDTARKKGKFNKQVDP
jgi:hypothetical protein